MNRLKLVLFLSSLISASTYANMAFNYEENAINLIEGVSIRSKTAEQLGFISLSYTQPSTLFRADGRRNFEFLYTLGLSEQFEQYTNYSVGISQDIMLVQLGGFYAGLGVGGYVKNRLDDRINTRTMIGEKAFIGYRFSTPIGIEVVGRNFNDISLSDENKAQNYVGLSFSIYY